MTLDLHTHSHCSDGTQSPTELIDEAHAKGLSAIGLTDHDTVAGWAEAEQAARATELGLVRGMEVSCRYQGVSVHMLAYLHRPADNELMDQVQRTQVARLTRTRTIVERLAADYPITWDDVEAQREEGATIGRPHIADALVARGIVPNRSQAFTSLLSNRSKYYVPIPVMDAVYAIGLIHDAGGVAVFAHPVAMARGRVVAPAGMREFIAAGLDGLEIYHRDNPPAQSERLAQLARDHGLIVTGSSDYHGQGKPNQLGENTTAPDMLERIAQAARGVELITPGS